MFCNPQIVVLTFNISLSGAARIINNLKKKIYRDKVRKILNIH